MTEDLVHLINRQFAFLERQSPMMFVRELRRTMNVLRREPRLAAILDDEKREALGYKKSFDQHCAEMVDQLRALRQQVASHFPDDDAKAPPPSPSSPWDPWHFTLAGFDAVANGEVQIGHRDPHDDNSLPARLIEILRHKLNTIHGTTPTTSTNETATSNLDTMFEQFNTLNRRHVRAWRILADELQTAPGFAIMYLEDLLSQVISTHREERSPLVSRLQKLRDLPSAYNLTKFLYEDSIEARRLLPELERDVIKLKEVTERVREGLVLRIGTTRSLLAIFERFKVRCEWHDRERLRTIAKEASSAPATDGGKQKRSNVEEALTLQLAIYLFDQGLNPITEVPTAGLRPDVLDPERIYVEAKQYSKGNPKTYLRTGIHQMHQTIGRLQGSSFQVREAFYVVFRLGGQFVQMPESLRCDGWTIYPRIIDLAPSEESGSQARAGILITEDEMRPRVESTDSSE